MAAFRDDTCQAAKAPVLLERTAGTITVAWEAAKDDGAIYELQMQSKLKGDDEFSLWVSLSSTLKATFAKKKNLEAAADAQYKFRVRHKVMHGSIINQSDFTQASDVMTTLDASINTMTSPTLNKCDGESVSLSWDSVAGASGYKLRFRHESEPMWTEVADGKVLSRTEVRKKGLQSGKRYFFAVLPVLPDPQQEGEGTIQRGYEWGAQGGPFVPMLPLSATMKRLLPSQLLTKQGLVDTDSLLSGKVVLFYFSAHWCGPCRQFTPQLASLYKSAKQNADNLGKKLEVVFCSADHDEAEFDSYYKDHPWLAVPYQWEQRERLMGAFGVKGIPQLSVVKPDGNILVQNAAQGPLSVDKFEEWTQCV